LGEISATLKRIYLISGVTGRDGQVSDNGVGTNPTDESTVSDLPVVRQLFGNPMLVVRQIVVPYIREGFLAAWRKLFGLGLQADSSTSERCSQKT
jgi:hypothetical protein